MSKSLIATTSTNFFDKQTARLNCCCYYVRSVIVVVYKLFAAACRHCVTDQSTIFSYAFLLPHTNFHYVFLIFCMSGQSLCFPQIILDDVLKGEREKCEEIN
jgi:hypothetical protein